MYSYQRNQQPALKGNTLRVRDDGTIAHPELHYARQQVITACRRAGNLFAHWRRYTPEFNKVPYCPLCYNPRTHTPVDENCPVCYGTGFEGGYSKPTVQHMIAQQSDRRLEATDSGFVRLLRTRSHSPYLPNIEVGDLVGEVKNINGEIQIGDRYLVETNVDKKRFRLGETLIPLETHDHLDPESDVYAYNFEMTRIPKHAEPSKRDVRYSVPFEHAVWLARKDEEG